MHRQLSGKYLQIKIFLSWIICISYYTKKQLFDKSALYCLSDRWPVFAALNGRPLVSTSQVDGMWVLESDITGSCLIEFENSINCIYESLKHAIFYW